jgi:hypothetical protein
MKGSPMSDQTKPPPDLDADPDANRAWWTAAADEFCRRMFPDDPRRKPAPRRTGLDFGRVNAFALDRLDELLTLVLPIGAEIATPAGRLAWEGWHPDRKIIVRVNLLTGAWDEPVTGLGGRDLVSLAAHILGLQQIQAARQLAAWCGISGRCHV